MYLRKDLQEVVCAFDLPFQLAIPDTSEDVPEIGISHPIKCLISTTCVRYSSGGMILHGDIAEGDLYGRVGFTKIKIRLNKDLVDFSILEDNSLIDHSVAIVNRLISSYRDIYNRPVLNTLSRSDIVHFNIQFHLDRQEPIERSIANPRGALICGINKESLQKFDLLRKNIGIDGDIDFGRTLQLEVDRCGMLGDYKMLVILSALLFEYWIKSIIKRAFLNSGMAENDADLKFYDGKTPKPIYIIVKKLIPEALGFNFVNSKPGINWRKYLKDVRNDVIHGTKLNITKDEAVKARKALTDANLYINEKMSELVSGQD